MQIKINTYENGSDQVHDGAITEREGLSGAEWKSNGMITWYTSI